MSSPPHFFLVDRVYMVESSLTTPYARTESVHYLRKLSRDQSECCSELDSTVSMSRDLNLGSRCMGESTRVVQRRGADTLDR